MLLVTILQGFIDRQRPILKIYRIPRQSDHLAGTQAGFKDQRVLIVVVGTFRNFKKSDLLIPRQKVNVVRRSDRLCVTIRS